MKLKWMMFLLPGLFCMMTAAGQGEGIEKILSERDIGSIRKRVNDYLKEHPTATGILYLKALIESDAHKAVEQYKRLVEQFPTSSYSDDAQFKIAQYQYARGFFSLARKDFLALIERYPESPLRDGAAYFAAQCLFAMKNEMLGVSELRQFVRVYPESPFMDLAHQDIEQRHIEYAASDQPNHRKADTHSKDWPALQLSKTTGADQNNKTSSKHSKTKYAVQIGAFRTRDNAYIQKVFFQNEGYSVSITEKLVEKQKFYIVLLDRLNSREAAQTLGEQIKSKYNLDQYVVIESP